MVDPFWVDLISRTTLSKVLFVGLAPTASRVDCELRRFCSASLTGFLRLPMDLMHRSELDDSDRIAEVAYPDAPAVATMSAAEASKVQLTPSRSNDNKTVALSLSAEACRSTPRRCHAELEARQLAIWN